MCYVDITAFVKKAEKITYLPNVYDPYLVSSLNGSFKVHQIGVKNVHIVSILEVSVVQVIDVRIPCVRYIYHDM